MRVLLFLQVGDIWRQFRPLRRNAARSKPTPTIISVNTDLVYDHVPCGSGLAREGVMTGNKKARRRSLICGLHLAGPKA
jgi:hypothetical protein